MLILLHHRTSSSRYRRTTRRGSWDPNLSGNEVRITLLDKEDRQQSFGSNPNPVFLKC